MGIKQVLGIVLMITGAIMTFFIRSSIKGEIKKINEDEDDDFGELLSMSAMVFRIIGFAIVAAGAILFFF